MPFGGFASLGDVARAYEVALRFEPFITPMPHPVKPEFQDRLEFLRENAPVSASEEAVCEFLIAPILQEVWIAYSEFLMIWTHVHFGEEAPLNSFPDYFFSRRSPLGPVLDQPYVLFFEAKRDNFDEAWAQCLAAMLAAQGMNSIPEQTIHGGVSNGEVESLASKETLGDD